MTRGVLAGDDGVVAALNTLHAWRSAGKTGHASIEAVVYDAATAGIARTFCGMFTVGTKASS